MNVKEGLKEFIIIFIVAFLANLVVVYIFESNFAWITSLVLAVVMGVVVLVVRNLKGIMELLKSKPIPEKGDSKILGDVKKLDRVDVALVKLSVFFFTLLLLKLIPGFLEFAMKLKWWVYLILVIVVAIRPVYRAYR